MIIRKTTNLNKVIEVQSIAFIKEFLKNSNETFTIHDKDNDFEEIELKHKNLLDFYKQFLMFYEKNKTHFQIFGADKVRFFKIDIANIDILKTTCKDLWNNPENYLWDDKFNFHPNDSFEIICNEDGEELDFDDYNSFLKYIWVKNSDNVEYRLCDLIDEESLFDKLI